MSTSLMIPGRDFAAPPCHLGRCKQWLQGNSSKVLSGNKQNTSDMETDLKTKHLEIVHVQVPRSCS